VRPVPGQGIGEAEEADADHTADDVEGPEDGASPQLAVPVRPPRAGRPPQRPATRGTRILCQGGPSM